MVTQSEHKDFINKIISAAQEKPEFRKLLLDDPKKVFENKFNFKLPENFEIVVHEDTANKLNIVLPHTSEELTEVELSAVSGGICWTDPDSTSCQCT
jgi:hypothetical protein